MRGWFAGESVAGGEGGSRHCRRNVRAGAGVWQLSERVHLPDAARAVGGPARLGLPELRQGHSVLRQRPGVELGAAARTVSQLFGQNYAEICGCGTPNWRAVPALLLAFRTDSGNAEVRGVWVSAARADFHRR